MILNKQFLNQTVTRKILDESLKFSKEEKNEYDIFISYSWNDREFAYKIVYLLEQCGYKTYVDYKDIKLDRTNVNEDTARELTLKMKKCKALLYLHSPSASVSKWCPWEVGYFSGIKNFRCANLPLVENAADNFKNQEYLEIYPYIEYEIIQNKNIYDFWVCEDDKTYTSLRNWISGGKLTEHN